MALLMSTCKEVETMWFILQDLKTGYYVRLDTNPEAGLVEDPNWATSWAHKDLAATKAGELMDDFRPSNPLAGITLRVVRCGP